MINSAIGTRENIRIIDSAEHGKMKVEVMEYQKLLGQYRYPGGHGYVFYGKTKHTRPSGGGLFK